MNKQSLIQHYSKLYREAGDGSASEETNDQLAHKNILILLRNIEDIGEIRGSVERIYQQCDNQDRKQIYDTFWKETRYYTQ